MNNLRINSLIIIELKDNTINNLQLNKLIWQKPPPEYYASMDLLLNVILK